MHVHVCACPCHDHDAREEVKLGDGQAAKRMLEIARIWGPIVAAILGVKLPPLPVDDRETVPAGTAQ